MESQPAQINASINLRGAAKPSVQHRQASLPHARVLREKRHSAVRTRRFESRRPAGSLRCGRGALHLHVGPRFPTRLSQTGHDSAAIPAGSDHGVDRHSDSRGGGGLHQRVGDAERGEVPARREIGGESDG